MSAFSRTADLSSAVDARCVHGSYRSVVITRHYAKRSSCRPSYCEIMFARPSACCVTVCHIHALCRNVENLENLSANKKLLIKTKTRHRASTSMYSLTFRVRVTTPPQHGRNGKAHTAGASILSLAMGVFAVMRSAWHCVRRAVGLADYRWALLRIFSVAIQRNPCTDCKSAQ